MRDTRQGKTERRAAQLTGWSAYCEIARHIVSESVDLPNRIPSPPKGNCTDAIISCE